VLCINGTHDAMSEPDQCSKIEFCILTNLTIEWGFVSDLSRKDFFSFSFFLPLPGKQLFKVLYTFTNAKMPLSISALI